MRREGIFVIGIVLGLAVATSASAITLTAKARDFQANGVEFEGLNWSAHTPAAFFANNQNNKIEKGIVGPLGSALGTDGDPVYSSVREPGFYNTVPNEAFFNQWWDDVSGVNIGVDVPLTFADIGQGTYRYNNTNFFPIDGLGFGNQGYSHNYHFTMELRYDFIYNPGQTVLGVSDDDLWVFVDGKLVLDMGGIHGGYQGSVSLDSLGLLPGHVYSFAAFFAERNTTSAAFGLETNTLPAYVPEPASCGLIALAAVGLLSRRHQRT